MTKGSVAGFIQNLSLSLIYDWEKNYTLGRTHCVILGLRFLIESRRFKGFCRWITNIKALAD
ncbi:hypothetical protein DXA95_13830 [Odoribacter sp. OF09-27XD]|nr:hypothetical protein DXA95_13830 [Odoribacter sp. OF09-27XD]